MPTYRQTPAPSGTVVAEGSLPAPGAVPANDIWLEVELEDQRNEAGAMVDRFTYYLIAKQGVPYRPGAARTGSA